MSREPNNSVSIYKLMSKNVIRDIGFSSILCFLFHFLGKKTLMPIHFVRFLSIMDLFFAHSLLEMERIEGQIEKAL